MRFAPALLAFALCAPALGADSFDAARAKLIAEADALTVAGAAVGRGAQQSRFHALVGQLTAAATPAQLEALLAHDHVVVRAAGMVGLARTRGTEAVAALEARRRSDVRLAFQPQGCGVMEISEGELATRLLLDADLLELRQRPRPLISVPLAPSEPKARRLEWALAALRIEARGLTVSGSTVGFAAQPGRFYLLSWEIGETGDPKLFAALAADEDVVVRAAGLVLLAQRGAREVAVETLTRRLESEVAIDLQPSGCGVERTTEGALAQALLDNANALDPMQPKRPLR